MLDLCCGSFAVGRVFAERGWEVVGVDLVEPPEVPKGCTFVRVNILQMSVGPLCKQIYYADESGDVHSLGRFDFIWASTPCDEFSCWTMKMFQPNPKHPATGIRLFSHARHLCEASGSMYVMENVRGAQQFVGDAIRHCGPFYMWGNAVPPIVPQGITKAKWYKRDGKPGNFAAELALSRRQRKAILATIPAELSGCVADYISALQCVPRIHLRRPQGASAVGPETFGKVERKRDMSLLTGVLAKVEEMQKRPGNGCTNCLGLFPNDQLEITHIKGSKVYLMCPDCRARLHVLTQC